MDFKISLVGPKKIRCHTFDADMKEGTKTLNILENQLKERISPLKINFKTVFSRTICFIEDEHVNLAEDILNSLLDKKE